MSMKFLRPFLLVSLVSLIVGFIGAVSGLVFSWRTGEISDIREVSARADAKPLLYNGFSWGVEAYHTARYLDVRPAMVAYGSSRSMQFRSSFFTTRFYNFGGISGTEEKLSELTSVLHKAHKPETILYVADFWRYANDWLPGSVAARQHGISREMSVMSVPFQLLRQGRLSVPDIVSVVTGRTPSEFLGLSLVGVNAVLNRKGFGPDGSNYDFSLTGSSREKQFLESYSTMKADLAGNSGIFHTGFSVAGQRIRALSDMKRRLADEGIRLVVISPPVSPRLYDLLSSHPDWSQWLEDWRTAMREQIPDFQDFLDPASLSSPDCEFIDAWHGGDVTYARLMLALSRTWPDMLKVRPDMPAFIARHAGEVIIAEDPVGRAIGHSPAPVRSCWSD
tara:strand:- start:13710 stop:14885 length:1176 start_codon:yes stop_codon:yes gene_type:complete